MIKWAKYVGLLILPFIVMVVVNESIQSSDYIHSNKIYAIKTANSAQYFLSKCSWACHNDTSFCMSNHVTYLKKHLPATNRLYFGAIGLLRTSGNYALANVIILVFALPFTMWYFIVKSLIMQSKMGKKL